MNNLIFLEATDVSEIVYKGEYFYLVNGDSFSITAPKKCRIIIEELI